MHEAAGYWLVTGVILIGVQIIYIWPEENDETYLALTGWNGFLKCNSTIQYITYLALRIKEARNIKYQKRLCLHYDMALMGSGCQTSKTAFRSG